MYVEVLNLGVSPTGPTPSVVLTELLSENGKPLESQVNDPDEGSRTRDSDRTRTKLQD